MIQKNKLLQAENPLILRCHRLMEAFAKSDDERDFYLERSEGFILYIDLDKPDEELSLLDKEIESHPERYVSIPKMTFYETKKIMEGFVNEKVYDIDTKEKLLEIIQSKEARENFLDFIFDHHAELEKWQQYYQERSRIRIIEWLRQNHFEFVFEEDLDLPKDVMEKVKAQLFEHKGSKEVIAARKALFAKAKTYYSNEALNPRPKRGRPPKQVAKTENEPQMTQDIYTSVPRHARPFLFIPEYGQGTFIVFSQKFENEEQLLARKKSPLAGELGVNIETLNQKLLAIRSLSDKWEQEEKAVTTHSPQSTFSREEDSDDEWEDEEDEDDLPVKKKAPAKKPAAPAKVAKKALPPAKAAAPAKVVKKPTAPVKKAAAPAKPVKKPVPKKAAAPAKPVKKAAPLARPKPTFKTALKKGKK
jgi:hypothetical protein